MKVPIPFNSDMADALKIDIEDFVRIHQDGLRSYLRLLGCHENSVDDVAQEAFLVFLRKGPGIDDHKIAAAYLRRCAFNLLRDSRRSDIRHTALLRQNAAEAIWARYQLDDRPNAYRDALRDCLAGISGRMRTIVDHFYAQDMSGPEVAKATGSTEADVWTSLHRSRERLRSCINRKLNHET